MAENTEEEHLAVPTNKSSENPPGESPSTSAKALITPTQDIENMEVHHHAHNPAEPHHKKNWKAYFWEFLMLFLAVFCGFLAEYQLEHKIESDRGKQYTFSFYEDLITDSLYFSNLIEKYQFKLIAFQSMSPCYDSLLNNNLSSECLATIAGNANAFPDMIFTDRTLIQLKNAGGLRLLKKADADSILLYDNMLREYKVSEATGLQQIQNDVRQTWTTLRDYQTWKDTTNEKRVVAIYGNNKELLNKYFNQLSIYSNFCKARAIELRKIKQKNEDLIAYFKSKYHYE